MKVGDTVIVTNRLSSLFNQEAVIVAVNFTNESGVRTPLGYFCSFHGYRNGVPIPFMKSELTLCVPSESAGPHPLSRK